ncbi:unnamed protein product, partial [marine sediment metagenome]
MIKCKKSKIDSKKVTLIPENHYDCFLLGTISGGIS